MERNIDVPEEYLLLASRTPPTGDPPTTQTCALTGTQDLLVRRLALNPLSHTSQGPSWPLLGVQVNVVKYIHLVQPSPPSIFVPVFILGI